MALEAECPVCSAYIPIDPGTSAGSEIFCSYCSTKLMVTREMVEEEDDGKTKKVELEENWD